MTLGSTGMTREHKTTKTKAQDRGGVGERLDNGFLETLVGYNARRAWSQISTVFSERMAPYGLKQVDFSVLSLLAHNPGATSRQLCATLDILPPNLVNLRWTSCRPTW